MIVLTRDGHDLYERIVPEARRLEGELLAALDGADRAALDAMLRAIEDAALRLTQ